MFKDRSSIDVVVIILTCTIAGTLVVSIIGLVIMKLIHPEADTSRGAEAVSNIVTTIVGALVGFIGGRATGKYESANGKS